MDHRPDCSRSANLLLILGCAAALGCGGTRVRGTATGGAGGGGHGGISGDGGRTGTGGVPAHGGTTGGVGSGGTTAGGSGGGTTAPATTCAGNNDCSDGSPFCEPALRNCVACVASSECPTGGHCLGNRCVTFTPCISGRDCGGNQVCDPGRGLCVQCAGPSDCPTGQACVLDRCVAAQICQSASDCGGKQCDSNTKSCVACLTDGDCAAGTQHCVLGGCRTACTSDNQCTPLGLLCDTTNSTCVQCKTLTDCPASTYCEGGACKADICDSTQSTCSGNGVSACNDAGNGWAAPKACSSSQACVAYAGVASCGAPPSDAGSPPGDGGPPPTDVPATGCTTATATPCTNLSRFGGSQTMDGNNNDFCDVPAFQFGVANAQAKHNYNNVPDSQVEVVTAQVAWSQNTGIHAFFNVKDSSVQTVNMVDPGQAIDKAYQGDSIELFISSSDTVTGLTATDNNTLHIIVPANGPAVQVKASNNGGISAAHTALPTSQYFQLATSTGYVIELQLPWPGSAPTAGARIRFDLALNSADKTYGTVDDMRDAQLVYTLATLTGATTCAGTADAWCDDRTWCSTTLAQ